MRKIIKAFLFLSTLMLVSISVVYADDVEVTLSYRMEGIKTHELKVIVYGPGILRDGEAEIRDGTNVYELREDAEKVFLIEPDEGSHLASVKIDGQEVTDTVEKQLVIKDLKEDSELIITFEKDNDSKDPNEKNPNGEGNNGNINSNKQEGSWNGQTPQTGVVKRTGAFLLLTVLSASVICYVKYREHEDDPNE